VKMKRSVWRSVVVALIGIPESLGRGWTALATLLCLLSGTSAYAVSCTTQAEMKEPARSALAVAARTLASNMQAGDANAVKAATIPSVASNFDRIASTIQALSPDLKGATLNVTSVYDLQASDAQPTDDTVQFFCGEAANAAHVIFNIPRLPAGHFGFAIVEATGVKKPQRLSLLLEKSSPGDSGNWQLAGFFPRPLMAAGHDGIWYWEKARDYKKAGETWNAYFYYQTAIFLLLPADFIDSNNFDKLIQEQGAATPAGLPGAQPMSINVDGAPVTITNIHTDSSLGGYDLVVNYNAADTSNPVAARTKTVALMKSLLAMHPEWKNAFHGLWVFAHAPNQPPFSLELAMPDIASQS
jgi:hypothetical protein